MCGIKKMECRPAVSIVMSVYNTESYLEKSINSCLSQTLESIEIILVDNGSTDGSRIILEKYRDKYPEKIKFIAIEKNIGCLLGIDTGIAAASGEYIGVHDSDDTASKNMYEYLYHSVLKHNADMSVCGFERINDVTGILQSINLISWPKKIASIESDPTVFIQMNCTPANKLVRSNIAKQRVEICKAICERMEANEIKYAADLFQHSALFPLVKTVSFVNEPLYKYAVRTNSAMSDNMRDDTAIYRDNALIKCANYLIENFQDNNNFLKSLITALFLIHNGYSIPYYRYMYNNSDISTEVSKKVVYFDQNFPDWRNNQYFSWAYVLKKNRRLWKFALLQKFMKVGILGLFLKVYSQILKLSGRGIRW